MQNEKLKEEKNITIRKDNYTAKAQRVRKGKKERKKNIFVISNEMAYGSFKDFGKFFGCFFACGARVLFQIADKVRLWPTFLPSSS
jgi:hypothetical protein